jgi:hypothetical protein
VQLRRFRFILVCLLLLAAGAAMAGVFKMKDGSQITGDPISMTENGVEIKQSDGTVSARQPFEAFASEGLKALMAAAKTPHDKALLQPLVESLPEETAKAQELVVKPVETPLRPTQNVGIFALFGSPLGWMLLLVLYGANIFAAYEIALFRKQPVKTVCGLAAVPFFGVLSPIAFIAMPPKAAPPEPEEAAPVAVPLAEGEAPPAGAPAVATSTRPASNPGRAPIHMQGVSSGATAAEETAPAAPARDLPAPVVFTRGEFTFNRRFFETKFAGFFRAIRTEAEKDLVLFFKTNRGNFVGRRITNITPNELYLQTFNNEATADEMIPFIEVMEVQIRHKDAE